MIVVQKVVSLSDNNLLTNYIIRMYLKLIVGIQSKIRSKRLWEIPIFMRVLPIKIKLCPFNLIVNPFNL